MAADYLGPRWASILRVGTLVTCGGLAFGTHFVPALGVNAKGILAACCVLVAVLARAAIDRHEERLYSRRPRVNLGAGRYCNCGDPTCAHR